MKSALIRWFQNKSGIGENRDRLAYVQEHLEKKLNLLFALQQLHQPEVLPLESVVAESAFVAQHPDLPQCTWDIHKSDMMFLYAAYYRNGDLKRVYESYMKIGFKAAQLLRDRWDTYMPTEPANILDFGAGHGRVARFLSGFFPQSTIHASEIKPGAVHFLNAHFNLQSFLHSCDYNDFKHAKSFDLIWAGSVFTHLNREDFEGWLIKLSSVLASSGLLMFSIHDFSTYSGTLTGDFVFETLSEDVVLHGLDDHLADEQAYGVTYLSQQALEKIADRVGLKITILKNAYGGTQDVVLAEIIP